jgi:hypothetical protein
VGADVSSEIVVIPNFGLYWKQNLSFRDQIDFLKAEHAFSFSPPAMTRSLIDGIQARQALPRTIMESSIACTGLP